MAHEVTDFPKHGEDEPVSLKKSRFEVFDPAYAKTLRDEFPEIWDEGGNVIGNEQFETLLPIAHHRGKPHGPAEEEAVRKREAWAARHHEDFRLAGTVAQIKWLVVGACGEAEMKRLIDAEKKKREKREEK